MLEGRAEEARARLRAAADLYRRSMECAPPASYGRLIGMVKAAVLAGEPDDAAAQVLRELPAPDSPTAWYAVALAALATGDDELAARAADGMRAGGAALGRAAEAVAALAGGDAARYAAALRAIVADFEARDEHLTGVPFADTALALERLAEPRGLAAGVASPLLPRR